MHGPKLYLQCLLRRIGIYERIKASFLYDAYWSVVDRSLVKDKRAEQRFYRSLLAGFQRGDTVFDVGANQGTKTATFLSIGARVIAVEPDRFNQRVLSRMFIEHRLRPKPVTIVGKALSECDGAETMWIDHPGSAKNTFSRKWVTLLRQDRERFGDTLEFTQQQTIETTTLDSMIATYGKPAFIKIDVEGHELSVLRGLTQPVPCISFEVNLPEFREEGLLCIERLAALEDTGRFNFIIDCRHGLALSEWVDDAALKRLLSTCSYKSVEVIWRTGSCRRVSSSDVVKSKAAAAGKVRPLLEGTE